MERRRLGRSGLVVSSVCLGTMTFGTRCDLKESLAIMDYAYDQGIDFFDTAELYPVPPQFDYAGRSEEIIGEWLKTKPRDSVIIASKIAGPAHGWFTPPIRNGKTTLDQHQIIKAVEGSLRRLNTDYLDLYQTHWPDHGIPYEETLGALDQLKKTGKIRVAGCSNETSWGVMKSLQASENHKLIRFDTVQNNFSLINRRAESELAQVCRNEGVSLLPYSPLGGGVLTGKYNESFPEGARFTHYLKEGAKRQQKMARRFVNDRTIATTIRIMELAKEINVPVSALALAWSKQHDFVASTIVGANSISQLAESMQGANLEIDKSMLRKINQLDEEIPNPMKEDGLRRL